MGKEDGGRRKEKEERGKEEGGRRKEEGGMRKEEGDEKEGIEGGELQGRVRRLCAHGAVGAVFPVKVPEPEVTGVEGGGGVRCGRWW